ncbi:MAG: hypothetical protein Kow0026_14490 [Oricola sp.]
MKIRGPFMLFSLFLSVPAFFAAPAQADSRYAECSSNCKAIFYGKMHDKETPMGACDRGCQSAHWNGTDKGKRLCDEMFARSTLEVIQACRYGADRY